MIQAMESTRTFGNIKPGNIFMLTDDEGNVSVVKIQKANPLRNWFNVEGDRIRARRWINQYSWMLLTVN